MASQSQQDLSGYRRTSYGNFTLKLSSGQDPCGSCALIRTAVRRHLKKFGTRLGREASVEEIGVGHFAIHDGDITYNCTWIPPVKEGKRLRHFSFSLQKG